MKIKKILIFFLFQIILSGFIIKAANAGTYNINQPIIDQGGINDSTSPSYHMAGSVGQNGQFVQSSAHYIIKSGFEYFDYGFSAPYITVSLSSNSVNLGSLLSNSFSTGSNTATVTTNAIHGYNLYIQEDHDMRNLQNSSFTIPAFSGSSTTSAVLWTNVNTNGFGVNVSGSDAATDFVNSTYFRAVDAAVSHLIASTTSPTQTTGGDVTTITYKADPSGSQAEGNYQNTITYTVVGNY